MKKEDLYNSIETINPDPYMKARLKAKISAPKTQPVFLRKAITATVAMAVMIAMVLGISIPTKNNSAPQIEKTQGIDNNVKGFIMVANAANGEEAFETLEINETFPFAYSISFVDVRGMSEEERSDVVKRCADELQDKIEKQMKLLEIDNTEYSFGTVYSHEDVVFTAVISNSIKLDLKDKENIKSINVKNSSEWGYVEYYDGYNFIYDEKTKKEMLYIPHGREITIDINDYDLESGGFHWKNSAEMEMAINDNLDIPLSTFKDTITFTVEYKNGSKAIGIIDVSFNDEGDASFICRDYQYVD